MNEKKAADIYDYINDNQDTQFDVMAGALEITEQEARNYSLQWAIHPRGEFIFLLSKQS